VMNLHDERVRQRKILEQGAALVEQGKLGVLVSHRLPLTQAADAHRTIEAGGMIGKIVLTMGALSPAPSPTRGRGELFPLLLAGEG